MSKTSRKLGRKWRHRYKHHHKAKCQTEITHSRKETDELFDLLHSDYCQDVETNGKYPLTASVMSMVCMGIERQIISSCQLGFCAVDTHALAPHIKTFSPQPSHNNRNPALGVLWSCARTRGRPAQGCDYCNYPQPKCARVQDCSTTALISSFIFGWSEGFVLSLQV